MEKDLWFNPKPSGFEPEVQDSKPAPLLFFFFFFFLMTRLILKRLFGLNF